jgi:type IV pilus assembly protein PilA
MLARLRKAQEENEGGFTLIELLVVIIIIGILAAIAIPVFLQQRNKGYDAAAKSDLRNAATSEESYLTDFNSYAAGTGSAVVALLSPEGFKSSQNVSPPNITVDGTNSGYCEVATSHSGNFFYYDSEAGGLNNTAKAVPTGGACAKSLPATPNTP